MSVCAARPEPEGFFTTCASVFASGKCKCGDDVAAEQVERVEVGQVRVPDSARGEAQ
jgi:hypothetical protein